MAKITVTKKGGEVTKVTSDCNALSQVYTKLGGNSYLVERIDWEHGGQFRWPGSVPYDELPEWVKKKFEGKIEMNDTIKNN